MKAFVLAAALLVAAQGAYGNLVPPVSLVTLAQSADLIVVASASGDFQAGTAVTFTLQVSRVLKGNSALAGSSVPVLWTSGSIVPGMAHAGDKFTAAGNGLWFLKLSSGGWSLMPVLQGQVTLDSTFFPTPPGPISNAYTYTTSTSLLNKIASELAAAIESFNGDLSFQENLLQFGLLDQLNSPVVRLLYQRASISNAPLEQALGLAGLIRSGNTAALRSAVQAAPQIGNNTILLASIRNEFRAADSDSVAILGQAASTTILDLNFREAAAHALASIHTVAALPYLAALLDDPDAAMRVEAIGGLGAFANALPIETTESVPSLSYLQPGNNAPYKTTDTMRNFVMGKKAIERNEAAYLSFWKNWWSTQRTGLGY